jgi:hypothetical protein
MPDLTQPADIPAELQGSFSVFVGGDGTVTVHRGDGRGDELLPAGVVRELAVVVAAYVEDHSLPG